MAPAVVGSKKLKISYQFARSFIYKLLYGTAVAAINAFIKFSLFYIVKKSPERLI